MLPRIEKLDFAAPTNILFGWDESERTGSYCAPYGETTLVVTDPGILAADLVDPIEASLTEANLSYEIFDGVEADPKLSNAMACAAHAREIGADSLVGIGGGSSMDVAKTASVLLTNDVPIGDLLGRHNVPTAGLPTVLLPTTAGTGSEVSPAAVLFDDHEAGTGEKTAVIDEALYADTAIVDPSLTLHLPSMLTKTTGIDAFAHAIGSYMSTTSNTFADTLCVEAMSLIEIHLRDATFHGAATPEAREKMALASMMAMLGRVNGGKAATHALAYGIQAKYEVPHAEAIAMILPEVVEYNLPAATDAFARLGIRLYNATGSRRAQAQALVDGIYRLRDDLELNQSLSNVGATRDDLEDLANLGTHSERHLEPNPRPLDATDAKMIFEEML